MDDPRNFDDYDQVIETVFTDDITFAIIEMTQLCQFTSGDQTTEPIAVNPFSREITPRKKMTYRINLDHPEYTIDAKTIEYIKKNYDKDYLEYLIYKTIIRYMQYTFTRVDIGRELKYEEMNGLEGTVIFVVKWIMIDKILKNAPMEKKKDANMWRFVPDMVRMLYPEYI